MSTSPSTSNAIAPKVDTPAKGRKGSAAGGGKAWTEEEEVYLLQMRLERVAYKKIASHLDKTELACRLHYHQLSHGGNRRKRNNSISSNASNSSATSPTASPSVDGAAAVLPRAPGSSTSSFSPVNAHGAVQKVGPSGLAPKAKGKPLLPKPAAAAAGHGSLGPRKPTPGKKQLRVNCNTEGAGIDKEKLLRIVETHQAQFWETVAAQYGGSVDGEYLSRVWQQTLATFEPSTPPTPAISPASNANSPIAAHSPVDERHNTNTMSTVSEVSTPASALSPAAVSFSNADGVKDDALDVDRSVEMKEAPRPDPQPTAVMAS